jgi:tyrosyl-tRNA synthetase
MRQPLSDAEIRANMKHYLKQAGKVLDLAKTEVVKNGDWLKKMNFEAVLKLAGSFTASQMMQRDMFQERLKKGLDINLVEFFYPLMQGYDSVAVKADVEIGGNDQLFNLMAGRRIQEAYGLPAQDIITVPMLEGLSGTEKMSKSLNNYIGVLDTPKEAFGKTMSIPDHLMAKYFELLTDLDRGEIGAMLAGHPRDAKLRLAQEITTILHDAPAAQKARDEFLKIFADKGIPDEMPELNLPEGTYHLLDIVTRSGLCFSSSDARRQITNGAVKIDDKRLSSLNDPVTINQHAKVLQVGKRKFCRLVAR